MGQLCVNEVDIKGMRAMRAKFLATTPTFSAMNRRRNPRKCGNLRSSSKFAIAIVLTKQTMGVTVIIRVIIPGSKVTVQATPAAPLPTALKLQRFVTERDIEKISIEHTSVGLASARPNN